MRLMIGGLMLMTPLLRIPMRGYEAKRRKRRDYFVIVTNPHEGL